MANPNLQTENDVRKYLQNWVNRHRTNPAYWDVSWEDLEEDLPLRNIGADGYADLNVSWAEVAKDPSKFEAAFRELLPILNVKHQDLQPGSQDYLRKYRLEHERNAPSIDEETHARLKNQFDNYEDQPDFLLKFKRVLDEARQVNAPPEKKQEYISRLTRLLNVDYELQDDFGDPDKRIRTIQEKAYRYVFVPGEREKQDRDLGIYMEQHFGAAEQEHDRISYREVDMDSKHRDKERRHKEWQQRYLQNMRETERLKAKAEGTWSNPAYWEDAWKED